MFCPDCGTEVGEGRKFCGKCGAAVGIGAISNAVAASTRATPAQISALPSKPSSPAKKLTLFVLIVLFAVLTGVSWWWFHRPVPTYQVQDPGIYPFRGVGADGKTTQTGFIDADGNVLIQPAWDKVSGDFVLGRLVIFSEGLCSVFKDGKLGYIDTTGKLVIPVQFDFAGAFLDGLARVKLGNRFGYVDRSGQYAINPQFDNAGDFHSGLAAAHSDEGWGFIDKSGAWVIRPRFKAADIQGFSDGLAAVCLAKCGYISRSGEFEIGPQFDGGVDTFSEGMARVTIGGKSGYINSAGKIVIGPQFDKASLFSGGLAIVDVAGRQGTISKVGKYVLNPGQYSIQMRDYDVMDVVTSDGNGLLSRDGKWVVKPSKALTSIGAIFGKVFTGTISGQPVPISTSGKVLAGWYKGSMTESLAQDVENQHSAYESVRIVKSAEVSYASTYPAKGFATSLDKLGPAVAAPDEDHAGLIDTALASGTKDGYQFVVSVPAGGTDSSYFVIAKPVSGHGGPVFCSDASFPIHFSVQPEECTLTSPVMGD
jgi:hypothetical protein